MTARITGTETLYSGWTKLFKLTVRDGDATYTREVEDHGDAAAVLPYDPERRCAVLVRLLRAPVLRAAEQSGMSLEAPAGLTDGGDPAEAARREAMEEVGVRLGHLDHVVTAWTMPGISAERMALYLAEYAAADRIGDGGGLAEEHEGIEIVEMPLAELWRGFAKGEIVDMKTLTLLLALRERRPELFADGTSSS